ncbi:MAG: hypothetical protein U1F25_07800 [Rubrivivax sp.]
MATDPTQRLERWARLRWAASNGLIVVTTLLFLVTGVAALTGGFLAGLLVDAFETGSSPRLIVYPFLGYLAFFVLPVLQSLPLLLPLAFAWRQPRRIVVFRRFNRGREGAQLQRLINAGFARFGHVFTLADAAIKVPWTVRVPVFLGQLALVNFRPRTVDSDRKLLELQRLLGRPRWLNINWFVSLRKIFPVRASDEYWQRCVSALLEHADLVVVDVSVPRDTLLWEITQGLGRGLAGRMIFLGARATEAESRAWLAGIAAKHPEIEPVPVWWYDKRGVADPAALRESVVQRLVAPMGPAPAPPFVSSLASVAGTLGWSGTLAAAAVVASAPYVFSEFTARRSPWRWQVYQAYLYGEASRAALERMQRDFPEQARAQLLAYARSDDSVPRRRGLDGLAAIGDRRTIRPLVELANAGSREDARAEANAVRDLVKRLGAPAAADYMDCMRALPAMAFDREIDALFEPAYQGMPTEIFAALLAAPSEAARFTAAFRLAAEDELRVVPVLLEALAKQEPTTFLDFATMSFKRGMANPHEARVRPHLERMLKGAGKGRLDVRALDRFLADRDVAAAYAAQMAFVYATADEMRARVAGAAPSVALLAELARQAADPRYKDAPRAAAVLSAADAPWLAALLAGADSDPRLDAALALAMRGDVRSLAPTLELLREQRSRRFLEFGAGPWFRHEPRGLQVLDYLASTLAPSERFPERFEHLDEISFAALVRLVKVVARTRDDQALKALVVSYARHPSAEVVPEAGIRFGSTASEAMAEALPRRITPWLVNQANAPAAQAQKAALGVLARAVILKECSTDFASDWSEERRCQERRLPRPD